MIELKNVRKTYGARVVLDIPELTVPDGQTLALVGANGSGKTTLLRVLAGLLKPDDGAFTPPEDALYLPQKPYAFRGTLRRNMLLGIKGQREKADALLEKAGLAALADRRADSLSGGELQKLALCRLLMRGGRVLLLDEPTSACDANGTNLLTGLVREHQEETGCAVVMATHAPGVALRCADRLLVLCDGKIAADGPPAQVLSEPQSEEAERFLADWRTVC